MSTPLGGGHIIFAFSGVRRPTWFPDILGNSSYPIFTKFGMQFIVVLGDRLDFPCRCSYRTFVTKLRTFPIMESKCKKDR